MYGRFLVNTDVLGSRYTECNNRIFVDFQDLFPGRDLNQDDLSVITISQKTNNDMIAWNVEMEVEREELMEHVSGRSLWNM